MPRLRLILPLLLALCAAAPAGPGPALGNVTKLPVPRFVSLRSDQVNFRAGPGFQYPVSWVYERDGLPVEITGEFDVWRQVVAPDGGTGWVHEATVRARRTFYVTAAQAVLHASADPRRPGRRLPRTRRYRPADFLPRGLGFLQSRRGA